MKLNIQKEDIKKINQILIAKEHNIVAAELYIDYLTNHYNDIKNISSSFIDEFLSCLEIDKDDEEFIKLDKNSNISNIKELDASKYLNNPFYKAVKFSNHKEGKWQLTNLYYEKYEGFVFDELVIDDKCFKEHTPLGYFSKRFYYPAIIENDTIWMSITPHEINTMEESIEKAKGDVLVIGLGIGYYSFMVSLKNSVSSVTIIEKDKNAINLFNKYILPSFKNKDKIKIINEDAYKYFDKNKSLKYDYCFFDIYHNVGDGEELYLMMKARESRYPNIKFSYWIEKSILAMLRRQILTLFVEEYQGATDKDYQYEENPNDRIINKLHFLLKEYEIYSYEDLRKLLLDESLKDIASKLDYLELF